MNELTDAPQAIELPGRPQVELVEPDPVRLPSESNLRLRRVSCPAPSRCSSTRHAIPAHGRRAVRVDQPPRSSAQSRYAPASVIRRGKDVGRRPVVAAHCRFACLAVAVTIAATSAARTDALGAGRPCFGPRAGPCFDCADGSGTCERTVATSGPNDSVLHPQQESEAARRRGGQHCAAATPDANPAGSSGIYQ